MRKTRRIPILKDEDTDPLSVVVNLFDVAIGFCCFIDGSNGNEYEYEWVFFMKILVS